jgi:hypothetical protein
MNIREWIDLSLQLRTRILYAWRKGHLGIYILREQSVFFNSKLLFTLPPSKSKPLTCTALN